MINENNFSLKQKGANHLVRKLLRESIQHFNQTGQTKPFENVLLVSVQHVLGTTVDMLAIMKEFGLETCVIGGKTYSTHKESATRISNELGYTVIPDTDQIGYGRFNDSMRNVVHDTWNAALAEIQKKQYDLLVTLDDGADLLKAIPGKLFNGMKNKPKAIIGIEQTRNGSNDPLFHGFPFTIINAAGSFIKNLIECPWVTENILNKVTVFSAKDIEPALGRKPIIGVLGYGSIGKAMVEGAAVRGFEVIYCDENPARSENSTLYGKLTNPVELLNHADIIIGCTGVDVLADEIHLATLQNTKKAKWLISASSKDIEFNSLLRLIQNKTKQAEIIPKALDDIFYTNELGTTITIKRGGFPLNFTNEEHSVRPERIWPTRMALLQSLMYGVNLYYLSPKILAKNTSVLMLCPEIQLYILKKYMALNPDEKALEYVYSIENDVLLNYIINHSEGEILKKSMIIEPSQENKRIVGANEHNANLIL